MDWYASLEGGKEMSIGEEEELDWGERVWKGERRREGGRGVPQEVFAPESLGLCVSGIFPDVGSC